MEVKPIYYNGFINFLHTPESDEERAAMVEMAIRSEAAEKMSELYETLFNEISEERKKPNGNL